MWHHLANISRRQHHSTNTVCSQIPQINECMYAGIFLSAVKEEMMHVSVLRPNRSSCCFPRTWDLTSSRPARQPTTLTARPCPSERAPSRHAPTWRDSWTLSQTVRGNALRFMLAPSAGLRYCAFSLPPKPSCYVASTTLHDSSCLEATSRMCSAKRSTGLSVPLIQWHVEKTKSCWNESWRLSEFLWFPELRLRLQGAFLMT